MTQQTTQRLDTPAAPNLPNAPAVYSDAYGNSLTNVLRLYFNRLTGNLQAAFGPNGAQYIEKPYGQFFGTGTYTAAAANTYYAAQFGTTYLTNGVSIVGGTKVTPAVAGVYQFQYRGNPVGSGTITLQVRRNGAVLTSFAATGAAIDFLLDVNSGDYVELYWATTATTLSLATSGGVPANALSVNFVSPLLG